MSIAAQVSPKSDHIPSKDNSTGPRKGPLKDDDEGSISNVGSLKEGIIKSSTSKAKAPHTILLVGEIGVGKSSLSELFANVLHGNDADHYDFDILDHTHEQGRSNNQLRTNSARVYELTSKNGTVFRIIDTPGFADTLHLHQDTLQRKSNIATQIKSHIDSATAVLVLVNGTVPHITLGTDNALSTLSALSPGTPLKNVGFLLTNTSNPLFQNFSGDALPERFKDAPRFLLNNPIALQRRYLELNDDPNTMGQAHTFREAVKVSEQDAFEMLRDLFNWLDSLERQPASKVVSRYGDIVANVIGPLANFLRSSWRRVSGKSG